MFQDWPGLVHLRQLALDFFPPLAQILVVLLLRPQPGLGIGQFAFRARDVLRELFCVAHGNLAEFRLELAADLLQVLEGPVKQGEVQELLDPFGEAWP